MPDAGVPGALASTPDSRLLTGWGRTAASRSTVAQPRDAGALRALLEDSGRHGVIPRGLGRSYGDAGQCAGGTVVQLEHLSGHGEIDGGRGSIEVEGGASLDAVMRHVLRRGWFPPVTPGTRHVTIGGALAADVHGKNHHRDGSIFTHVTELTLETPTGTRVVGPHQDAELFWATAGGMGLTGVITRATLRLLPVETDQMVVDTDRFDDLDAVMAAMEEGDDRYRYSVAWVDCASIGRRAGRSVLTRGDHARGDDIPPRPARRLPPGIPDGSLSVPRTLPPRLLNGPTIRAFNEAWYRRAPRHRRQELQPLGRFFHPLDGVTGWNRLYGPRGFVQYQFVVAPGCGDVVRHAIELLSVRRLPSFLAVLKRFGPGDPGPLSFPMAGWTLALDLPVGPAALPRSLDDLDELVAEAGGRVYLAKDARLRPELVPIMYPRLDQLAAVRREVDPKGVLRSDLSRRLSID
jgi:decaprenylphospho-beta-D-ribofuranose 2-oxidase